MSAARSILGLVPARGGSKGVPGKNVRPIAGEPLVARSVRVARESGVLDAVVVSTDDAVIAAAAHEAGAEVLDRPAELASDTATMTGVIGNVLSALAAQGRTFTHLMLLQPTSPLRSADDIRAAIARLDETAGSAVVSVCETEHSPLLANTLPEDGSMSAFLRPEVARANRQELPRYYRLNGAIYLAELDYFRETGSFVGEKTFALIMPLERSVDIDSEIDFALAELLAERAQG